MTSVLDKYCGSAFWDLIWESHISFINKMPRQRMYFWQQLVKLHLPQSIPVQLYTDVLESVLTSTITVITGLNASLLDRPDPDLTVCFERTVLVWIPLGFLWFGTSWQVLALCKSRRAGGPCSRLYLIKQILACLLFLISVAELIFTVLEDIEMNRDLTTDKQNPVVLYVNASLYILSWFLVMLIHEGRRRADDTNSACLFIFWLLSVLCDVFMLQTLIRIAIVQGGPPELPRFVLFCVSYGLKCLSLVASSLADISAETRAAAEKNPQVSASFLSRITFNWFNGMMWKGYRKPLETKHLWELNEEDQCQAIFTDFEKHMVQELRKAQKRMERKQGKETHNDTEQMNGFDRSASQDILVMEEKRRKDKKAKPHTEESATGWLVLAILKTFWYILLKGVVFKVCHDTLLFVSPQLLKLMVSFTEDESIYMWKGYLYAVLLFILAALQSVMLQQYFNCCFLLGMRVRTAIIAAVYKKALTVSNEARKDSTVGEIVNMMAVDAQRFNDVTNFIHLLWSAPLQIIVGIAFLWQELGPSVLAGFGLMILLIPINGVLASKSKALQVKNMKHKDWRMKLMNDILSGIKVMKFYAWEPSFEQQIFEVREKELKMIKKSMFLLAVAIFLVTCTPFMVSLISFAVYLAVDENHTLDAGKAFTSISLFNILRFPLIMIPMLISSMTQATVSCKRLEKFLGGKDLDTSAIQHNPKPDLAISFSDATFSWDKSGTPTIKDVTLDIKMGSLLAVVGPVGCGKSSLMSAILGEMENVRGFINTKGTCAYVPQQAWIQNNTLQDNILFGLELNQARYQKILEACALLQDLELLPAGDQTEIGEKGINLSGGQKQRVSLARAVYSDADIYILDDPLSAVDAHVGKHIFEKVIGPNGLLKGKTRILVTHNVTFLPQTDNIIVLVDGSVSEVGSYKALKANRGAFADFLNTYGEQNHREEGEPTVTTVTEEDLTMGEDHGPGADEHPSDAVTLELKRELSDRARRRTGRNSKRMSLKRSTRNKNLAPKKKGQVEAVKGQRLIEDETMETGKVKFKVYWKYLRAIGWLYSMLIALMYLTQYVAAIGQNLWLSDWTNDANSYINATNQAAARDWRIGIFGVLGLAQGTFVLLGAFLIAERTIVASRDLHSHLLHNILHLPMSFFDTTPTGRIVNRFAKDIYTIDEAIPMSLRGWLSCFFGVLSTLLAICLATPYFTIVILPLAILYYFIQRFYVVTSRQLRRLDSVTRSPIYSHFGETVTGLALIRAYGHQTRFLTHNEKIVDDNQKCVFPWIVSNRWLAIRLEFVGNLVVFFAALFAVLSRGNLNSGLVGLSISYALNVTQALNWLVRQTSELETNIVSVERVAEYSQLENEAPWVLENRPEKNWPSKGEIRFVDYKARYRPELDLVLQGFSCDIRTNEKIGIVGRTGAGKSSLTNCLFRIIEAAGGKILIDGLDISTIGLHDLRQRLTIIPQDPVMFSGAIRMNLDPFNMYSDEEVWNALELAHLKNFISGLPDKLQHGVSEGGENLSVGQRQLLCLARALLRKSKILILDEATAAVDLETDELIQRTIRSQFADCTMLIIAHRLFTIMDCTRVMVLDTGRILEFDTPAALLQSKGCFYHMALDAGITLEGDTAL